MARFYLAGLLDNMPLRFEIDETPRTVGRIADREIHIQDQAISRSHAKVSVQGDKVVVEDLDSLNGTFINGNPLKGTGTLVNGDKLRFGHVTLTVIEQKTNTFNTLIDEGSGPGPGPAATLTTTIQEIRSQATRSRSDRMLTAVAEAGQMLSKRMELSELYENVLDLLDRFVTASRFMILEGAPGGGHRVLASRVKSGAPDEPLRMSQTMLRDILENGRSLVTADAGKDWDTAGSIVSLGVQAALGAPLFDNDRILGALYLDSRTAGLSYQAEELQLVTLLANMVAVKITNSRLEAEERKLEVLRNELGLAARIQRNLLPRNIPEIPGFEIFVHQAPCDDIGGDLYDVQALPDGRIWLALGDVTGHGIGAALLMSNVMAALQILETTGADPLTLVTNLETNLERNVDIGQFVTLFAGLLDPATGRLEYVNAGQQPPIVLGGSAEDQLPTTGAPVAILPGGQTRTSAEYVLEGGRTLLIFSDGISESMRDGVQYDEGRMQEFLAGAAGLGAEELGRGLLADIETFGGGAPPLDDLTLLIIRRR